jgi:hypothetical protein
MIYSNAPFDVHAEVEKWPIRTEIQNFSWQEQQRIDEVYRMWSRLEYIEDEREREILREALALRLLDIENECIRRSFVGSPAALESKLYRCWKEKYLIYLRTEALNHPIFKDLNK